MKTMSKTLSLKRVPLPKLYFLQTSSIACHQSPLDVGEPYHHWMVGDPITTGCWGPLSPLGVGGPHHHWVLGEPYHHWVLGEPYHHWVLGEPYHHWVLGEPYHHWVSQKIFETDVTAEVLLVNDRCVSLRCLADTGALLLAVVVAPKVDKLNNGLFGEVQTTSLFCDFLQCSGSITPLFDIYRSLAFTQLIIAMRQFLRTLLERVVNTIAAGMQFTC